MSSTLKYEQTLSPKREIVLKITTECGRCNILLMVRSQHKTAHPNSVLRVKYTTGSLTFTLTSRYQSHLIN